MKNKVVRYSLILTALMLAPVFAAGDYNNELVKMDLDQTSDGAVKVNIYTDKPYNEQIIVNKKPDNKYVILLPETTNTMNVKPDISGVSSIKNVDVKTQQYSSLPGKGYTKITIDSKKPIEVVPKAFVTKPVQTKTTKGNKPSVSAQQVQMALPQRVLNQQRPMTNSDFVPSYERQRHVNQQNYVATPQQTVTRREAPQQTVQRTVQQYTSQPVQQVQQSVSSVTQQSQQTQVATTTDNSALTQNEQVALEDNSNQAVDDANQQQLATDDDDITEDELAFFKKIIRFKQKVAKKIKSLLSVRISFSSIITVLQFILLVVLIKIIGDLVKRIQYPTETPSVTRRLIHDNDETFEQAYPSYSNMDVYNTNRSNFEEDSKEGFNVAPLSTPLNYKTKVNNNSPYSMDTNYRTPQAYPTRNDFYKPLNEINEEDKMSIFDENSQDIEKAIFKNPLTQISKHDEETLFDEVEPAEENTPFAEDNYAIKENEGFFNYGQTSGNDEDFFIFEDEDEDEDAEYQEDYVDEDEDPDYDEYDEDDDEEYEDDSEYEEEYEDEEVAEQTPQQQASVDPFEHLSVQAKYVIDSNRGFAQVNVDGINALIGYVGSKISVIRKFKEDVKGSMQVRLNEQPDAETMIYIIKLGSYKTLVEVKPNSIRQLLDL